LVMGPEVARSGLSIFVEWTAVASCGNRSCASSPIDSTTKALQPCPMHGACTAEPAGRAETTLDRQDVRTTASQSLNEAVRQALQGSHFALQRFLREVAPQVRRICRGIMGRDHAEIEDAIQECLVEVVRALPQFRFEADVSHYVTKIAMRRAIAARQRSRARSQRDAAMSSQATPVMSFDDGFQARASLVRNLLDDLGEPQSTVLRLRLMLGHSIGEIASITGVSVNTVKTRLRLGKDYLRRQLERSGERPRAR
jgi:RNA polymerase sigma-70 factor (ECF subfamily)